MLATFCVTACLVAGGPLEGEPAPRFSADTCINAPEFTNLDDMTGEVVLLEFWGTT
jgi:hypothetical protein